MLNCPELIKNIEASPDSSKGRIYEKNNAILLIDSLKIWKNSVDKDASIPKIVKDTISKLYNKINDSYSENKIDSKCTTEQKASFCLAVCESLKGVAGQIGYFRDYQKTISKNLDKCTDDQKKLASDLVEVGKQLDLECGPILTKLCCKAADDCEYAETKCKHPLKHWFSKIGKKAKSKKIQKFSDISKIK